MANQQDELLTNLVGLVKIGIEAERERCASVADEWLNVNTLLLRAGEMTLQEKRTVLAVVASIAVSIRNPTPHSGDTPKGE